MGIFSFFKKKQPDTGKLNPESKWIVEFTDSGLRTIDYEGIEKSIEKTKIEKIIVETNDSGPWGTDVWWRILTKEGLLSVPGGATGESEMLKKFQAFQEFDNEQLINAMSSTDNAEFVVWKNK